MTSPQRAVLLASCLLACGGWARAETAARQKCRGSYRGFDNDRQLSYTVYRFGPSFDPGRGWTGGGYYQTTDAKHANYTYFGKD